MAREPFDPKSINVTPQPFPRINEGENNSHKLNKQMLRSLFLIMHALLTLWAGLVMRMRGSVRVPPPSFLCPSVSIMETLSPVLLLVAALSLLLSDALAFCEQSSVSVGFLFSCQIEWEDFYEAGQPAPGTSRHHLRLETFKHC